MLLDDATSYVESWGKSHSREAAIYSFRLDVHMNQKSLLRVKQIQGKVDFAIITIREDEFESVLKRFSPRIPVIDGKQVYEYCSVSRSDGQILSVAIVRAFDQGQSIAQLVARDVIDDLAPKWLILTGIAGGIPDSEFSLGDVLLASSIHDFSINAATQDKPLQIRPSGGSVHPNVERLLGALPAWRDRLGPWNSQEAIGFQKPRVVVPNDISSNRLYGSQSTKETVLDILQRHFPSSGFLRLPLYKIGAVVSSNVLLKDSDLLEEWRKCARQITHIEMEAGGVYKAARHTEPEVPLLCVRGISDIVGFRRDPAWTQFACDVAASFLHAMITVLPLEMFRIEPRTMAEVPPAILGKASADLKTPTIEEIRMAFERTSTPLLSRVVDLEDRIPLSEEMDLKQFLSNSDEKVLCLLGTPGSGKTALLALVSQEAIASGIVPFAVKADLLPKEAPFENWGRRVIRLDISAIDAIRVVAAESRVLVVVDQLDALASTVDLTSDRLNDVLDFIAQCSSISNVSIICSCRKFDFDHDARFTTLKAKKVELTLPPWEEVDIQLVRHGIKDAANWPEQCREMLRTPQHLRIYLDRIDATGSINPFESYFLMLDDLWDRMIQDSAERDFLYELTDHLVKEETLWIPQVKYENNQRQIDSLKAKLIIQKQNGKIGFRHQTLFEHAKARLFTKEDISLSNHVLERQNAVMVRPTVWAVLQYLREVNLKKYLQEIEDLFKADLRLHLRYLLIEFLGQIANLKDLEIAIISKLLGGTEDDQRRILIAIRGNAEWFQELHKSHFPDIMGGSLNQQWAILGVINNAWNYAREECINLLEKYWLPDSTKDEFSWRALAEIGEWNENTVEMACKLIRRAESGDRNRLWWAEYLVSLISENKPKLAPRVFLETVSRLALTTDENGDHDKRWAQSPLESSYSWHELPAVAEAAPTEFLREGWEWLVQICEEYHTHRSSTVLLEYIGSCSSLDERPFRTDAPIMIAFCTAIDTVAMADPKVFCDITKASWVSDNAVVHRLLIRGLCLVVREHPEIGIEYFQGDRRRFNVGSHESHRQSDSIKLVSELAPRLTVDERQNLENMILNWSQYGDEIDLCEKRKEWDREARLRLLTSIPPKLLSRQTHDLVEREKIALTNWDHQMSGGRTGFVHVIPPITKEEMLTATNDEILATIKSSEKDGSSHSFRNEVEGGWEEPGGPHSVGLEISKLAQEHPKRAVELVETLVSDGEEEAAASAIDGISASSLKDDEIYQFLRSLLKIKPKTNKLRSQIGHLLYKRCKKGVGLPDDFCVILAEWLSEPWGQHESLQVSSESQSNEYELLSLSSVLWHQGGGLLDVDESFWLLMAITEGYLMRSPSDPNAWLDIIEKLIICDIAERTWAAYCTEFRRVHMKGCDYLRGAKIISKLFEQYPRIGQQREGMLLVAYVSDLLSVPFVQKYLHSLRNAKKCSTRQAYGELLTLIALRNEEHVWASEILNQELEKLHNIGGQKEPIAVGMAFAASQLWDVPEMRDDSSSVLCRLVPVATDRIGKAISTVFWAQEDFPANEATKSLLQTLADHSQAFLHISVFDLIEHLVGLLPHDRVLVLAVCKAILKSGRRQNDLFDAGPSLVKIAMTLQRFNDTRSEGLSLLEEMMRLGLDDAFRLLREIDIRPTPAVQKPRPRRRRQKH